MCARCEGVGKVSDFDLGALYDDTLSLREGALTIPGYSMDGWYGRIYMGSGFVDPDKAIKDYTKRELAALLYQEPTKIKVDNINVTYERLIPRIQKSMLSKDREAMQPHIRAFVDRAVTFQTCPDCAGTRLNEAARSSKIKGINIADACQMQISDLAEWVRELDDPSVGPLLEGLQETLDSFVEIGLDYLSLDRSSGTLSGGEAQRTKMIRHLGSALTDVTYVFDEPTIGLHPHDIQRMNSLLLALRDKGNTVLVVEHKPEVIEIADHVIDLGPGAEFQLVRQFHLGDGQARGAGHVQHLGGGLERIGHIGPGLGLGAALGSWILAAGGYIGTASSQTDSAKSAIVFAFGWFGVILAALLMVVSIFLNLDDYSDQIRTELEARHGKQNMEA